MSKYRLTIICMMEIASHYLEEAFRQMRGQKRLAEGAIAQLRDDELFRVVGPESNSVAIIMKHMAGNMRSRFIDFLTTDGEKPTRHRDQEFIVDANTARDDVIREWEDGWNAVLTTLKALNPEDVMKTVTVRGEPHTVLQAINRQIAHYAHHSGQILFLAKYLRGDDWKTLSVPRGKSEEFNRGELKLNYSKGVVEDRK